MQEIGLILDIIGSFWLAFAFVIKRIDKIVEESMTYWDQNISLMRSMCYQKAEAVIGLAFLIVGFLSQIVGIKYKNLMIDLSWFYIFVIFLLLFILSYFCFVKILRRKFFRDVLYEAKKDCDFNPNELGSDPAELRMLGKELGVEWKENEGLDDFIKKLRDRIKQKSF